MKEINGVIICLQVFLIFKTTNGWSWECDMRSRACKRTLNRSGAKYPTLDLCHLVCGSTDYLNIWPYPTGPISSSKEIIVVDSQNMNFQVNGPNEAKLFLEDVIRYFKRKIPTDPLYHRCETSSNINVTLNPLSDNLSLTLDTDESYSLISSFSEQTLNVQIEGNTVFGVRHGIETLLQLLVAYEKGNAICLATLSSVQITDKPVYHHRGLLLDSARNYLSLNTIKKNIDGMAASKLNVLHWHITDSQSFPLEVQSLPNMTIYGAYSEKQVYKQDDIKHLVNYAKIRGVRLLMEIDGPSHAGNGWQWGSEAGLGNLAVCLNQQPWRFYCIQPPCGQLNPANPNIYNTLQSLYKDIENMVPNTGLFHLGGDEVYLPCWNSTKEIIDYLKGKPPTEETFLDLWGEYQSKALTAYDRAVGHNKTSIVVWTSTLTDPKVIQKYLPKERYIIHTWVPQASNDLLSGLLNLGYRLIISTKDAWYLDHGFWGSTPFYSWRNVYKNKMYYSVHPSILGGEVCMWGELVDDNNIEPRIWPRAAAAAERLWTNPSSNSDAAQSRFFSHRERLLNRGIKADAEIPKWCVQNDGDCSSYL